MQVTFIIETLIIEINVKNKHNLKSRTCNAIKIASNIERESKSVKSKI